jgi:hypothetical protein
MAGSSVRGDGLEAEAENGREGNNNNVLESKMMQTTALTHSFILLDSILETLTRISFKFFDERQQLLLAGGGNGLICEVLDKYQKIYEDNLESLSLSPLPSLPSSLPTPGAGVGSGVTLSTLSLSASSSDLITAVTMDLSMTTRDEQEIYLLSHFQEIFSLLLSSFHPSSASASPASASPASASSSSLSLKRKKKRPFLPPSLLIGLLSLSQKRLASFLSLSSSLSSSLPQSQPQPLPQSQPQSHVLTEKLLSMHLRCYDELGKIDKANELIEELTTMMFATKSLSQHDDKMGLELEGKRREASHLDSLGMAISGVSGATRGGTRGRRGRGRKRRRYDQESSYRESDSSSSSDVEADGTETEIKRMTERKSELLVTPHTFTSVSSVSSVSSLLSPLSFRSLQSVYQKFPTAFANSSAQSLDCLLLSGAPFSLISESQNLSSFSQRQLKEELQHQLFALRCELLRGMTQLLCSLAAPAPAAVAPPVAVVYNQSLSSSSLSASSLPFASSPASCSSLPSAPSSASSPASASVPSSETNMQILLSYLLSELHLTVNNGITPRTFKGFVECITHLSKASSQHLSSLSPDLISQLRLSIPSLSSSSSSSSTSWASSLIQKLLDTLQDLTSSAPPSLVKDAIGLYLLLKRYLSITSPLSLRLLSLLTSPV